LEQQFDEMGIEEIEVRRQQLEAEEAELRRKLRELEQIVQCAPGAHRPGAVSRETLEVERRIQEIVLRLSDIDAEKREISILSSI
jgi:endonuclease YncB( thermonuclease family)